MNKLDMKTKEAIERVRSRFNKWALDDEDLKALQALGLVDVESEDERIIEQIKFAVMQMSSDREDTKKECLAWLENLRKRIHWKPSQKQMIVLTHFLNIVNKNWDGYSILLSLYNQLNSL